MKYTEIEDLKLIRDDIEALGTYTVEQINPLSEVNGVGFVLRHNKTKARFSVVLNDDDNKVFAIAFRTPPTNSKGIQHIVEHTVLCGSKKYPVKDPFVELAKGSLNTFLNAMTYSDKTVYPVASCNDKDFHNLIDVYLDAVFNPNIYDKEEIFKQEGWHYEMDKPEGDITINGVVYNEMRGVYSSPDTVLANAINRQMYPDTIYSVDSGGDPDIIPDLSREEYLDYHRNYYHPSNSYIYLYGDIDICEQLKYIDEEYLSKYDYLYVPSEIPVQKPLAEPVTYVTEYGVTDEDDMKDSSILTYNVVIGESKDKYLTTAMNIIQYILVDSPGAPLKKKIVESGICADVESQYDNSMQQPMFSLIARDAAPENQEKFVQIVEDELRSYVENGLDKVAIEAALNFFEFKNKEAAFRFPKGLALGLEAFGGWLYDDSLVQDIFNAQEVFDYLRGGIEKNLLNPEDDSHGYFEEIIKRNILDNSFKSFITAVPKMGLNTAKDAELKEKLKKYKESLSSEEIEKIIEETAHLKAYQEEPSTPEELATIPMLTLQDLKREVNPVFNRETEVAGVKTIAHDIFTNGITYVDIFFKISDIPYTDIPKLQLVIDLLKYVDTDSHKVTDLNNAINLKTGGMYFKTTCMDLKDDSYPYISCGTKAFDANINEAIDLLREVLTESHVTDKKRIRETLSEVKAFAKNALVEAGHTTSMFRALSYFNPMYKFKEASEGVDYFRYIDDLDKNFEERYDTLAEELTAIYRKYLRKDAMLISYTSKQPESVMEESIKNLTDSINNEPYADRTFSIPMEVLNEGFRTSSKVQYVATAADFKTAGLEFNGVLHVLKTILSYDYLWNNVRVKGGAYGAMCDFSRNGYGFLVSYRDPNLMETYGIYKKLPEYVESFECTDRDMLKNIIGTMSTVDAPQTPYSKGVISMRTYMNGLDDEYRQKLRNQILDANVEAIRAMAPFAKCLAESGIICAVGSDEKITEAADNFGVVTKII